MRNPLHSICLPRSTSLALAFSVATVIVGLPGDSYAQAGIRPYDKVVTADAVSKSGVFTIHRVGGQVLFEVPANLLGRDFLWYAERGSVSSAIPEGAGLGTNSLMVRLERMGEQVFIRNMTPAISRRAGSSPLGPTANPEHEPTPMERAVAESALAPPIAAIPVLTISPKGNLVLDATSLFRDDYPELKLASMFGAARIDPRRSYIESVKTFPQNVVIGSFVTAQPLNGGDSLAAVVKHSWTLLPKSPMRPRVADQRVGHFTVDFEQYSSAENAGVSRKQFVRRYRLEKKNPNAALSEPVKPIVYYVGRTVPVKWRPYIKQAIEDWKPAFEAAGFKNAIVAKIAPTEAEDPNWDPSDTRFSVIRWVANPIVNAQGPNIADPRSGEILSAHILVWADVLKIANSWYYGMCSAVDPRAQKLPLSDELTGRMLRYIVAHEVGHTLGLRHNHRASTAYTVAQLRDPKFCAEYGSTASIMAYGRMNYVAQPGDGVKPESLMPRVGPYDLHAIRWSYAPLAAEKESATLDTWAAMSLKNPMLAFGGEDFIADVDPQVQMQNIGRERVEASRLGMANLKIATSNLLTAYKAGAKDYTSLYDRWIEMLNMRNDYLTSVIKEIGGREETRSDVKNEPLYKQVPAKRQREALAFILSEGLNWDPVFYSNGVLPNAMPFGLSHEMRRYQGATLVGLFQPVRLGLVSDALMDQDDESPFTLVEYMNAIATGVFSEIEGGTQPTLLRRALQRQYFEIVERQYQVNPTDDSQYFAQAGAPSFIVEAYSSSLGSDIRAALRLALQSLDRRLTDAIAKSKDPLTTAHWADCQAATRRLLAR